LPKETQGRPTNLYKIASTTAYTDVHSTRTPQRIFKAVLNVSPYRQPGRGFLRHASIRDHSGWLGGDHKARY